VIAEAEADSGRQAEAARAQAARAGQLEIALEETRRACAARDRRVAYLEAELDLSRSNAASQLRALAALGAELEELRVTARGQATRIRLGALREAAEVSTRIRVLAGAPEAAAESMLAALERAVERLGAPEGSTAAGGDADEVSIELGSDGEGPGAELAALEAALEGAEASAVAVESAEVAEGRLVSVDIGPFTDFSQLVTFEDAANAIAATSEISIRRFSEGRASIDVSLREPIDLIEELESRCELDFDIRHRDGGAVILDLRD